MGPFGGLEATYHNLYAAVLDSSDLNIGDEPAFEIYRTDPKTTPAEKLVAEIYVPLAEQTVSLKRINGEKAEPLPRLSNSP